MSKISYAGYRFPPMIIQQAVWLYARFTLSFRDVEDLLAERGIMVSCEDGAPLGEILRTYDRS
jgi:transposase-like protein